jgi:16S rRNA processing protein RimM
MTGQHPGHDEIVQLGYIAGVHGIKGWVKVHSFTQPMEAILDYRPWLMGEELAELNVLEGRPQGKTLVASLPGVDGRSAAQAWVGRTISVRRAQLPEPPGDSWYWADLVGLEVRNLEGLVLGKVANLLETGAHDVLVVRGERERLIPFVPGRYITRVALTKGLIEVDWDPED